MTERLDFSPQLPCEEAAIEVTRSLLQKHYWESNVAADEDVFDEPFFWFGAAEPEFSVDREAVLSLFRQFPGKVPKCNLTDEEFHAAMIAPRRVHGGGALLGDDGPLHRRIHPVPPADLHLCALAGGEGPGSVCSTCPTPMWR